MATEIKTVVILMLCWMLPKESQASSTIDLNMSIQSVDDKYFDCTKKMAKKVQDVYFQREMENNFFKSAWNQANATAQKKYNKSQDRELTKDHIQSILVYSKENPDVYTPFNAAVRNGKPNYTTTKLHNSFPYHALHFWLTSAVQILNPNKQCSTTYRRCKVIFQGNQNQEFRFGSFTSSSRKTNLTRFGNKTCFKIKTCFGAYLKDYPALGKHEEEVLIPPYEKFKIIKIGEKGQSKKLEYEGLEDCEKIFVVKSSGERSDLNCMAT